MKNIIIYCCYIILSDNCNQGDVTSLPQKIEEVNAVSS